MGIESSFRRAQTRAKDRGDVIPDSKPKKAATPQLVMEAGVIRPVFKFNDGEGLTDAFGNVYDGYGGAGGGNSVQWTHTPSDTLGDEAVGDADDEQILVYDDSTEDYRPQDIEFFNVVRTDGTAPQEGDIAVYDSNLEFYVPQKSNWPVSAIIEVPVDRVYTLVRDGYDYDVEVVDSSFSFETGPGSVSFPTGVIDADDPIEITVSGTDGTSAFLEIQLDLKRRLAP